MATQFDSAFWVRTGLTNRLGIKYPIIQGPLVGLSSQCLTAAIGFADFRGNKQFISVGNLSVDDRISLFIMDYPNRQLLKL